VPRVSSATPFESLLERHGRSILRFCIAQVGPNRADDVFQETMMAALRSYGALRDPQAAQAWLFSIATRKVIDANRSAARSAEPIADLDCPAHETEGDDWASAVWQHVGALPPKQRQAIALRYIGDLSHREIADAMDTSEAAARRNVFEAIKRLRGILAPLGEGPARRPPPVSPEG
jgi:RNA polymerase sigma factor (sigma-70 family)